MLKDYHDTEWGVPVYDDKKQFEHLMMEAMQCGLSWEIVLRKRDIMRACFDGFDFEIIASYGESDVCRIMNTDGMIRCASKIRAVISNAGCFATICREYGSFYNYLCGFCGDGVILYDKHADGFIPASNGLSDEISRDLKKRGFKYVGSITVYSHLQACGIINDHGKDCHCYSRINEANKTVKKQRYSEHGVKRYD